MITVPKMVCGANTLEIIKNRLYVNGEKVCDAEIKDMEHSQYGRGQPYFCLANDEKHFWIDNAQDHPSEWVYAKERGKGNKKPLWLAGVIKLPKVLTINGSCL